MATEKEAPAARVGGALLGLALLAAGAALAIRGDIVIVAGLVTAVVAVVAAAVTVWRSFATFICAVIVVRPLLDLTAGPRSAGLGPTDIFGGAVLLVSLVWLWTNRTSLAERLRLRLSTALLAMLLVMAISAFAAPEITSASQLVLRVGAGAAIFFVLDLLLHLRRLSPRTLLLTLGAAYVIPLLYPLLGLVGVPVFHEKDGVTALKSVFFLSNNYGHFLVPLVTVAAAAFAQTRGRQRAIALAVSLVAGVELLGTQTRGAWFAAFVAVVCAGLLLNRRLALGAAVLTVVVTLYVPAVNARLTSLEPDSAQPRSESSLAWRIGHWEELLPMATKNPLIGIGPNESVILTGKEPHNDYVRALVETGGLGLITFLWFLGELLAAAWRAVGLVGGTPIGARRRARDTADRPWAAERATQAVVVGLGAYMVGVVFAALGENLIDNLTFLSVLMPCAALLIHAQESDRSWISGPTGPTGPTETVEEAPDDVDATAPASAAGPSAR